jgi:tetratricopeptide (TPR) repeat protein
VADAPADGADGGRRGRRLEVRALKTSPAPASAARSGGDTKKRWIAPILGAGVVAAVALAAFFPVLDGGAFVFDDHVLVERNRDLDQPDIWRRALASDYYASSENVGVSGYYRPLAVWSNALDARVWKRSPRGAHTTNLVLHTLASLAVMPALVALGAAGTTAFVAAVLFAAHPVHAESVAFISGRVDVLAALFCLLAMAFAAARARLAWLGLGIAAMLAFLSKELAVVLPALVVLVWWRGGGGRRMTWRAASVVALLAAAGVALALRYSALDSVLPATAHHDRPDGAWSLPLRTAQFVLASLYAPVKRLVMEPDPFTVSGLRAWIGLAVAIGLWLGAWRASVSERSLLRRGGLASVIAIAPVLNLLPQETVLSERFLYLASAFLCVPAGVLVTAAWRRDSVLRVALPMLAALCALALLGLSNWRAVVWRTDLSVWQQAVLEEPARGAFWDRLGLALTERRKYAEAETALRRAVALDARNPNAFVNLGILLQTTNRHAEAVTQFDAALRLQPRSLMTHLARGRSLMALQDAAGAYQAFATATSIKRDHVGAHRMAAQAALALGDPNRAAEHLRMALRVNPGDVELQRALERLGAGGTRPGPVDRSR